ncbi:MAG: glucokinase [Gemmatimonadetes bacterium]|nr:glucokinase [Gemmatimonadota bacterium]
MSERRPPGAVLIADIGGTNARFALVGDTPRDLRGIEVLACADFEGIEDGIARYLERQGVDRIVEACLAVAGPVHEDQVDLPNSHWDFTRSGLRAHLDAPLTILNDFTAQALAIDVLDPDDEVEWIGEPRPREGGVRTVIGPGTGLGVAIQTPRGEVVPSEGGHIHFAPTDNHEIELLRLLIPRYRRVSVERLVSGPGLENLFWANLHLDPGPGDMPGPNRSAKEVVNLAHGGNPTALQAIEDFFDVLAAFCGDMALTSWATGGIYLSGGMMHRLRPFLDPERFRARFEDKGRFTRFCETVAVGWIKVDHPGLLGCAAAALRHLQVPSFTPELAP